MKNKTLALYFIIAILLVGSVSYFCWNNSSRLFSDAVPDEETALKIAESVLASYGAWGLSRQPFVVTYDESKKAWIVEGSLAEGSLGFVPEVIIRKHDGMIMTIGYKEIYNPPKEGVN